MKKRIFDIPKSDRPREKLQLKGATALSDLELLAVLLGSGTKKHDVTHFQHPKLHLFSSF